MEALGDTPVVLLHGARQTGKTTLVRALSAELEADYLTFDDAAVRAAAEADPESFLARFGGTAIIDEVQRVPELALALKASVDRDRRPGRFLLTGSANVLHVPRLADALAGRMEVQTLWPLSQGEIAGREDDLLTALFADDFPIAAHRNPESPLVDRVCAGGYPEVLQRKAADRRAAWFTAYINTILSRDIRDLANIAGLTDFPRLLALLASRVGGLLNFADVARSVQLPQTTLKRYLALLETTFLVKLLPAWSSNLGLRLAKAPKIYLADTGLLAHLLKFDRDRLDPTMFGHVLENFVVMELCKQQTWSAVRAQMFHFRTQAGREVDLVIEGPGGKLVGVEIKAAAGVDSSDFRHLRELAALPKFHRGVVVYTGTETLPFGDGMVAIPVAEIWRGAGV